MHSDVFYEFDAFAESVRDVDSKMMLRNPKRRIWRHSSVNLDGVGVQFGQMGSGNLAQGQLRSDGYLLYVPITETLEYSTNGLVLKKDSFAILEPGCEFCISTKVEHDWCGVFIPTHMLASAGAIVESPSLKRRTLRVTPPNRQVINQIRDSVSQIMTAGANCPQFESTTAASFAAAELLRVASLVVGGQADEPKLKPNGRPKLPREEIIRRSQALLAERNNQPVLVTDLAVAAGVSERTLRKAFQDYFGLGPVRYMQLIRLHQVYRALSAADAEGVSVSEVIARHGEWDFGRFASRYRRLFGELPSETLRTKKS